MGQLEYDPTSIVQNFSGYLSGRVRVWGFISVLFPSKKITCLPCPLCAHAIVNILDILLQLSPLSAMGG